jgi:23S rRNA (cytosine1962-C5)-methyltransferase
VYRSDLLKDSAPAASLVRVVDERGKLLGSALYSDASQIAVRMISAIEIVDDAELIALVRRRVQEAITFRRTIVHDSDSYRILFSEADLLPGVIADKYNDIIIVQIATQAMDRADLRQAVVEELMNEEGPAAIYERVEPRIRELEQLPAREEQFLHGKKSETTVHLNNLKLTFNALSGQKTGAFLDQRQNYAAAAHYARIGRALDVFCYQGGFALHLARAGCTVTGVDQSREALEAAERNAALNGLELDWLEGNAFEVMREFSDNGERFDTIVLDPPAFAKSKAALEGATKGYKELNLRALKMLAPGGVLVTNSCSFHVSEADFVEMLRSAAQDARKSLRIIEKRPQAQDHPILLGAPETHYLKCVICQVV